MTDLAKLVVKLEAQTAKFQKDLAKADRKVKRFGKNTKRNLKGINALFTGLAIGALTRKIVQNTAKQELAFKQLEQGIKSTNKAVGFSAKELANYASELQAATTFGDEEIIAAQSKLVTFTKITGDEFKRTTEIALDMAARFGTDVSSASIQLGKALNDPIANLSALSRAGIQFSADQKEMIKAFIDSGDQASAQKVILKELETQFGGSARAARDTFGGALKSLGNSFGDLLEGGSGLSQAKESLEEFNTMLQKPETKKAADELISTLIDGFSKFASVLAQVPDFATWLGESIAASIYGPADLLRINEELASKNELLAKTQKKYDEALKGTNKSLSQFNIGNDPEILKQRLDGLKEEIRMLEIKKEYETPSQAPIISTDYGSNESDGGTAGVGVVDTSLLESIQNSKDRAALIIDEITSEKTRLESTLTDISSLYLGGFLNQEQYDAAFTKYETLLDDLNTKDVSDFQEKISRMEDQFLTEYELLDQQKAERMALLDQEIADKALGEEKIAALKLKINEKYNEDKKKLDDISAKAQIRTTLTVASGVLGIMSAFAGKSFKAQKALAIAEGIINIVGGVTKALNNPFPMNIGFASQVAAQGAALMSTIKGTELSSTSGSLSIPSGSGASSLQTPSSVSDVKSSTQAIDEAAERSAGNYQGVTTGNTYIINAEGYEGEKLGEGIRQFVEQGGEIIPSGSRQEEQLLQGAA